MASRTTQTPALPWPTERVKDLTSKIGSGVTPEGGARSYTQEGIPLLRSQNVHFEGLRLDDVAFITEETHRDMWGTRVMPGDVLLNITGASIGRCTTVPDSLGEANVNQHVCIIRSLGAINPTYLSYFLGSKWGQDQILASYTGASRQGLSQRELGAIQTPLPPADEQERMVRYLDDACQAIDKAVAAKREQLQVLESLLTANLSQLVTQGIHNDQGLEPSGHEWLGPVAKGWKVEHLKRAVLEPLSYGLSEAAEIEDRELPRFIRITDFDHNGTLREETFRSLPRDIAKGALLKEGDVLFARSGATVGKTFMFTGYRGEACFAGYLVCARTMVWKLLPRFLYFYTKSLAYEAWKRLIFTQTTIPNISAAKYNYLAVPLPPIAEQQAICEQIENAQKRTAAIRSNISEQIATLLAYRKSLIHECVTGQRRVPQH